MIQRKRGLIVAGLLAAIVGLVALFPARVAFQWLPPALVQASGIKGSLWNGSAQAMMVSGVYVTEVRWTARPLRLFVGELALHVVAKPASGFLESDVGIGLGGRISLRDLQAAVPLQLFERTVNVRGLRGSGSLSFDRIDIDNGVPVTMKGNLEVAGLVAPLVSPGSLGGYRAEFFTQESGVVASVEDTDGVIDVAGSLELRPDRSYRFLAQIVAKPETPEKLREQMKYLPPANDRGQHELRVEGTL
ncbi:MAG TPA: type II secretion system protein N [Woeseiaceae bacterium]